MCAHATHNPGHRLNTRNPCSCAASFPKPAATALPASKPAAAAVLHVADNASDLHSCHQAAVVGGSSRCLCLKTQRQPCQVRAPHGHANGTFKGAIQAVSQQPSCLGLAHVDGASICTIPTRFTMMLSWPCRLLTRALQQEIEGALSARGVFTATRVTFYWTALRVDPSLAWPRFGWAGQPALGAADYTHWGMYRCAAGSTAWRVGMLPAQRLPSAMADAQAAPRSPRVCLDS